MVSFNCENCGDVFTKKKLDQHYNRCGGAFTCLDCMTTFGGTHYRSHTSCISEDQKYQGALYKAKPMKNKKVNIIEPHEQRRQAYVEDAPEDPVRYDTSAAVAIVKAPPTAPSPPPSATFPSKPNVFDFLVNDETPNASKISVADPEPMQMIAHAPAIFRSHSNSPSSSRDEPRDQKMIGYEEHHSSNGFSYGAGPVPAESERDLYRTPAPKESRRRQHSPSRYAPEVVTSSMKKSTDKKRKRQVEDLDLTQAQQYADGHMEVDPADPNYIAPVLAHSGLTGGLTRMLSKNGRNHFPPSPADSNAKASDDSDVEETPLNVTKQRRDRERTRDRDNDAKNEARRGRPSATSTIGSQSGALVKVRKSRRTSDESRPRKHHRSHKHRSDEHPDRERARRSSGDSGERRRKPKAIEYNVDKGDSDDDYEDVDDDTHANGTNGQMVLYGEQTRAELFLSFITKGPDSDKGYSMNKALKRYHRERIGGEGLRKEERDRDKMDDEKELWKSLRLRRNERGEFVLFAMEE